VLQLELGADAPSPMVAVRLNDVAPDGTSLLVTYGLFNLTHRESHAAPAPLKPGETYRVRIRLNDVAHAFPEGHRVRIAISTSYWPMAWPFPARWCSRFTPAAARCTCRSGPHRRRTKR
jgi:predicted acyl esterase